MAPEKSLPELDFRCSSEAFPFCSAIGITVAVSVVVSLRREFPWMDSNRKRGDKHDGPKANDDLRHGSHR